MALPRPVRDAAAALCSFGFLSSDWWPVVSFLPFGGDRRGAAGRAASPPDDRCGWIGTAVSQCRADFGELLQFHRSHDRKRRASTDNRKRRNNRRRWAAPPKTKRRWSERIGRHQRPRNSWRPQLIKCKSAAGRFPAPSLAAARTNFTLRFIRLETKGKYGAGGAAGWWAACVPDLTNVRVIRYIIARRERIAQNGSRMGRPPTAGRLH